LSKEKEGRGGMGEREQRVERGRGEDDNRKAKNEE
jgi:hypothetical protein